MVLNSCAASGVFARDAQALYRLLLHRQALADLVARHLLALRDLLDASASLRISESMMADSYLAMDSDPPSCPFCRMPRARIVREDPHAFVVRDAFPVAPGHTLVISRRHVGSFFDLEASERDSMLALLGTAKAGLQAEFGPDGYNIGINDGAAAGQTVAHVHIHLIPRHHGDAADPRGGVRWVLPSNARYWT